VLTRPTPAGPGDPPAARPGGRRAPAGPAGSRPKRKSRRYPRSAVLIAIVLVLGAGAALYFGNRLISHKSATPPPKTKTAPTPAPTPTPTLGPNGHIGSRQSDPQPLTIAQLYPLKFREENALFTRTATRLNKNCVDAVVGSTLQTAIGSAGCSQAVRASYLSGKMMGTIGVFNLRTAKSAAKAGRAAGSTNFVGQLAGRKGPTKKLGHGNGVEEAVTKGHYLILIWAEFTDLKTPKSKAQTASLAGFMTEMLQGSANVSLSNRMVDGTPS
jgi:hypothetical protein